MVCGFNSFYNSCQRGDSVAMKFVHRFFKQIMWRSSKVHVADELELPSQEECLSWLAFSPIEEHFYQKQHETCVTFAHQIIRSCKDDNHQIRSMFLFDNVWVIINIWFYGLVLMFPNCYTGSDTPCNDFLSHTEAEKLLFSLLKLRQACCHPQVGSSGLCSLQRSPLTMEEILDVRSKY